MNNKLLQRFGKRGLGVALACLLAFVVVSGWSATGQAATEVTTCGQVVKGAAFLSGDLDCSSTGSDAVVLDGGTLDLRGFTITGDSSISDCSVLCTRSCKVISSSAGGLVSGGGFGLCDDPFDADVVVRAIRAVGIVVSGNVLGGIFAREAAVVIVDSTISNNGGDGAEASASTRGGRLRVINSTISNNGSGFFATRSALIRNSVVSGNGGRGGGVLDRVSVRNSQIINNGGIGLRGAEKNRILASTISGNGAEGILLNIGSKRLRVVSSMIDANGGDGVVTAGVRTLIRDSTVTNNGGDGVHHDSESPLRLSGSSISDNGFHGVIGGFNFVATDTQLTGNGTDPACSVTQVCADVAAAAFPNLSSTICDTSYDTSSGFPGTSWGVCSLD